MFQLDLLAPQAHVEDVCDALEALDALSVSVEDADADTGAERALFGEPDMPPSGSAWQRSRLLALFATEDQARVAAALLAAQDFFRSCSVQSIAGVPQEDWVRLTQSQFAPVQITPAFWIVPTWHEPPAQARYIIRLDPGLAFGTGTHPTTRMCLRWLAAKPERVVGGRVLDYGCGSGILAIAAAVLGASSVDAVDIDNAAVEATRRNALANKVVMAATQPDAARGRYGVVLANILATPLKVLAPLLCAHVQPGGALVLAGILERQAEELRTAYAPWMQLEVSDNEDGWILMTGRC